jgi:hypothetical protein
VPVIILIPLILALVVLGAAAGVWVRGWLLLPSDRKRLGVLASELYAEARMETLTRWTAQAMRDSVREHQEQRPVR